MIRRIGRNDPTLTKLHINNLPLDDDEYDTYTGDNYSRLGESISRNTQIKALSINFHYHCNVRYMIDGLRKNDSINKLRLQSNDGHGRKQLLEMYQEKNTLTSICIQNTNPLGQSINNALRFCTNLKQIDISRCSITDDELLPVVEAIKGHHTLEILNLYGNNIGSDRFMAACSDGCQALGALLADPKCNIHTLNLINNRIGNIGARFLANGLVNNTSLECLDLVSNNPRDETDRLDSGTIESIFGRLLYRQTSNYVHPSNQSCPTLKYYTNHTLQRLYIDCEITPYLISLLEMNSYSNKSYVATKKILKQHRNIVVEPLFGWDASGEWSLKSLPYLVSWFQKARFLILYFEDSERAISSSNEERLAATNQAEDRYQIDRRNLSVLYDFAKAMPLLFVPPSHYNLDLKAAINLHSQKTCDLLIACAARGESSINSHTMSVCRDRTLAAMRRAVSLPERELMKRVGEAEQAAIQLYKQKKMTSG